MTDTNKTYGLLTVIVCLLYSCKHKEEVAAFHFTLMDAAATQVTFNNEITESDSVNVFDNEYMYNGSGVGIGDFNQDGLPDIFFGASMVSSRLYINKGNFRFEDITTTAGVQTNKWCTGVSVVDINSDGYPDIYVCASHSPDPEKRKSLLFINDGKLHFTEQAAAYGLADTGYSTQAAFFDYDKDGDLDMYLLHHRLYYQLANSIAPKDTTGNSPATDKLYRNDGIPAGQTHPVFHDVSKEAGIKEDGYGLGVVITDVNNDNWPDVYVANDFIGNDLLWLNNGNGAFSNIIASALKHQSYNSMGVDAADINNDALPDLAVTDMLPENNERKKMMFNAASQEKYDMALRFNYEPSFVRNMLQLNNGIRKTNNKREPFYSEIGQLAGVSETDWSWSVLMADFDNDGWKDMHVTNGLAKDITNNDYATFKNTHTHSNYTFGGTESNTAAASKVNIELLRKNFDQYGPVKINNYFFHNNKDLTFTNATQPTGLATPSVSNGAAYADLDNDGDLDLVVNNMNQPAFIWRNEIRSSVKDSANNFIALQLQGSTGNNAGIGAKVWLYDKGAVQYLEQSPVRGFSSSVDDRLHFGVGNVTAVDSLVIQWPDDKAQVLKAVAVNQQLTVKQKEASGRRPATPVENALFTDVTTQATINFTHAESQFYDFGYRRSLPQKYSQLGPGITTGDINGDGLTDFFAGGAANQPGKLFIQQANGAFISKDLVQGNKPEEDLGALLFDADGDKDLDLLVTGGSPEFGANTTYNRPRLYTNDGKGNFILSADALPGTVTDITKAIAVADYDGDGDMDIFIGGRLLPQKYPQSPRSYLLQNDRGKFRDVTHAVCPALESPGMVTDAVFADINNDHIPDLVICGEWMPVRFFVNNKGVLGEATNIGIQALNGQWRSLQAADIDNDGDMDLIAGNLGLNNKFHITADRPLKLYTGDFDANNSLDIIPAYYIKNNRGEYELYPGLDRMQLADQVPSVKKKFLLSAEYAKTTMSQLLNVLSATGMVEKDCAITASVWIENLGNGKFRQHELPIEAQFAPINCIIADDIDKDGAIDLLLAGNEYGTEFMTGRYDACYGVLLRGNGKGAFTALKIGSTGFMADGDVRSMKLITCNGKKQVLVGCNNDALKCFRIQK